jgi:hypothetical protein
VKSPPIWQAWPDHLTRGKKGNRQKRGWVKDKICSVGKMEERGIIIAAAHISEFKEMNNKVFVFFL